MEDKNISNISEDLQKPIAKNTKKKKSENIEIKIARYRIVHHLSHGEIAKLLGVSRQAICQRLKNMDINAIFEAYRRKK